MNTETKIRFVAKIWHNKRKAKVGQNNLRKTIELTVYDVFQLRALRASQSIFATFLLLSHLQGDGHLDLYTSTGWLSDEYGMNEEANRNL